MAPIPGSYQLQETCTRLLTKACRGSTFGFMDTYKLVRFFRDDRPKKVIRIGLSLEEVQEHCKNPSTRGKDWFDSYEIE